MELLQIEVFCVDVYAPSDAVRTSSSLRVRQAFYYYCIVQCHSMVWLFTSRSTPPRPQFHAAVLTNTVITLQQTPRRNYKHKSL